VIKDINSESFKQLPGVLAIYTGGDLAAYGPRVPARLQNRDGSPMKEPIRKFSPWTRFALWATR
jgi:aerobic carbon-monoxide dehydrogenase large subunit